MNKRKVLDAARKLAQKGAKEKALKEYSKLLKEDSRDAKLLLEVGDAHRRWGQNEEAISHYVRVADQYMQGGFDARAVAVFKQILNLDGKRYPAYVSLAELYQRMGLDSEAANALQAAADGYYKEGQKREALELLRKMATLDPSNVTSRIKVAELLRQEELLQESIAEYEAVVDELVRQGASDELVPVYERILEMQPGRADTEFALARNLVQRGQPERAEPFARRAFETQKDGDGHFDLICAVYAELDRTTELTEVTRAMAQVYHARGDEDLARELMQRLPSDVAFDGPASARNAGATHGDEELLSDDGFLDDDFLSTDDSDDENNSFIDISGEDEPELDLGDEGAADDDASDSGGASGAQASLPEGDPDQLFAEASVYVRYGKRDQAIASLQAILAQESQHRDALEKIGECYADAGNSEKAVGYWLEAASLAQAGGDDSVVDVLRERIAVLDPAAAQKLARKSRSYSPVEAEATVSDPSGRDLVGGDDSEFDLDLDLESDDDANATNASAADESFDEVSLSEEIEVDDADDQPEFAPDVVTAGESPSFSAHERSLAGQGAGSSTLAERVREELEEAEFYMEQELFDEAEAIYKRVLEVSPGHPSVMLRLGELRVARGEDPDSPILAPSAQNEITLDPADLPFEDSEDDPSFEVSDEFDGNDSPMDLGADSELEIAVELDVNLADDDEADASLIDPNEIEVDDRASFDRVGDDEETTHGVSLFPAAEQVDDVQSDADGDYEVTINFGDDNADDNADDNDDDNADDNDHENDDENDDDDVSVDLSAESLQHDNTMPLCVDEDADDSEAGADLSASGSRVEIELNRGARPASSGVVGIDMSGASVEDRESSIGESVTLSLQVDEDDSFDLAAELRETLEAEDERDEQQIARTQNEPTSEEEGFASVFKDFKSGVAKTLAGDDFETRFDLGIAYRGMELYDDALGEFQICLNSPGYKIESLHMMGLCAIDLGRFADASSHLEQALSCNALPTQKEAGLRFDLARTFEAMRDFPRAKEAFEAAKEADATMPGINACIARVAAQMGSEDAPVDLDDSDAAAEGFESFDDLVAAVEAEDEAAASEETFESFDDVIAEVEAKGVTAGDASEPEATDDGDAQAARVEEVPPEEATEKAVEPDSGAKNRKKKKRISFV